MILSILEIKKSPKRGRGVFAMADIKAGVVIEISPVIVLSAKERKIVEQTLLFDYIFEWGENKKKACVALGYVSLYNHDYNANCEYEMDFKKRIMTITTVKNIKKGEELFVNYNANPNDKTKVWFDKS
jgi:SET domain-containing protein